MFTFMTIVLIIIPGFVDYALLQNCKNMIVPLLIFIFWTTVLGIINFMSSNNK